MKPRSILLITVAALFAASCSTTLQQRWVADELYENPDPKEKQENFMAYYEEAENILKDGSKQNVDSVIVEEKSGSFRNPYADIMVDDYNQAYAKRQAGMMDASYGMSDWYDFYFSDAYHYASAYDPSFYNVMVMGDEVWVEPRWLTSHFGQSYRYGSFYNYPYNPFSPFTPYSSSLSITSIYGFNYGYGVNYGYLNRYSNFYSGFYPMAGNLYNVGWSPFSTYNNYYSNYNPYLQNPQQDQQRRNYDEYFTRIRKQPGSSGGSGSKASFIRTSSDRKDVRVRRGGNRTSVANAERTRASQYVRTRKGSSSLSKPRYNSPNREANYERVRKNRSINYSNSGSDRKRNSVYNAGTRGSNNSSGSSRVRGSSSGRSSGSSGSSSSSGSSGRKRK